MANLDGQMPLETPQIPKNPDLESNFNSVSNNLPILNIQKDSKIFEPEVNVKTEHPALQTQKVATDNFDKFLKKAKKIDPLLLWGVLRPKILNNVTLWDFLVDRTVLQAQSVPVGNVPSERLKILLNELQDLIGFVTEAVQYCCEAVVKTEAEQPHQNGGTSIGIDDVIVPEKLLPLFGLSNNLVTLKANTDFAKYERLFALDESLKLDDNEEEDEDIKDVDLKNLDHEDLDILDFALEQEEDEDWKPPPPKVQHQAKAIDALKKPEKPRQCEKCKKVFPRRQNYHFHKTKGRCPGVPQPPKYHKLYESKYYCVHPDCGSGDGEISETTPVFTSRGIYWKHLLEKHITEQDKVFQCEVCPERFAYQEMLKFHLQQKHDKQYTCKYCGKNVSTRASLTKHERCHTGEKPYACDQCVYRTASLSSLARHKRCKHDENQTGRKHVCELCGKGFFTPNSLKEHMFTHSDIKRFSCHVCGKQLKNDSCYRRHMVCVHGQKYTCEICNKDFSALNGINLHKREVHGIMY